MRPRKRRCCSASVLENQYFIGRMPLRTNTRSNSGTERNDSSYPSSEQKPITRCTPARLHQLRPNSTVSLAACSCET